MVEIVQILSAGGFFSIPTEADMANPEIRPYMDKYLRGRAGVTAEERVKLFKLAWDVTGEAFGQRMQQYVHYYSGDPIRLTAAVYLRYNKQPFFDIVDRALGNGHDIPIPYGPNEIGAPPIFQGSDPTKLAHAYPAASLPNPSGKPGPNKSMQPKKRGSF